MTSPALSFVCPCCGVRRGEGQTTERVCSTCAAEWRHGWTPAKGCACGWPVVRTAPRQWSCAGCCGWDAPSHD